MILNKIECVWLDQNLISLTFIFSFIMAMETNFTIYTGHN